MHRTPGWYVQCTRPGDMTSATWTPLLDDGLGRRRIEPDAREGGLVEIRDVAPVLANNADAEAAMRARAERLASAPIDGLAPVRRIEREGPALRVISEHVEGLRLPELLYEAVKGQVPLPLPAAIELGARVLDVVAAMHQLPGWTHSAITPWHVIVTRSGKVVLTDAVFGPALEMLQRNREQLWREFRLAMPASASLPRFDQRSDVTQIGATVLAAALGRPLRVEEYPRSVHDVVIAATLAARPTDTETPAAALRAWLHRALSLNARSLFLSAPEAQKVFAEVLGTPAARRAGEAALMTAVKRIYGDTAASAEAAAIAAAWSVVQMSQLPKRASAAPKRRVTPVQPPPPSRDGSARPLSSLFRSVFTNFRPS